MNVGREECTVCRSPLVSAPDAFVRVTYPSRIVTFRVCRRCAERVESDLAANSLGLEVRKP